MKPQQGGKINARAGVVLQGENPQQATTSEWEQVEVFADGHRETPVISRDMDTVPIERITRSKTTLGAAQKDTAREMAARFANMRPVQWIGILCILGAGAFIYFQWWTPAMIAGGTGLGLILLAHSIVGNERLVLILLLAALAIVVTFRAYEKGKLDHILPDLLDKNSVPERPITKGNNAIPEEPKTEK